MTLTDPNWMQNVGYSAQVDRGLITLMYDQGVIGRGGLVVSQRAAGANMSVDIDGDTGAIIEGTDLPSGQGSYHVQFSGTDNVVLSAAPGTNSRYDRVVLRVNDGQAGGAGTNDATLEVITGTPASSPTVPAIPDSAISLAIIGPITSGTAAITDSMITDDRELAGRKDSPGIMKEQGGTKIPTGWLECNGQNVNRDTYANLFAEIGTLYGPGNGSTTFTLPDRRGRVAVAPGGDMGAVGTEGGLESVTLTEAQIPSHDHTVPAHDHAVGDHRHTGPNHRHTGPNHRHDIDHNHPSFTTSSSQGDHDHTYIDESGGSQGGYQPNGGSNTVLYAGGSGTTNTGGDGEHTHPIDVPNFDGLSGYEGTGVTGYEGTGNTGLDGAQDTTTHPATSTTDAGSGNSHENRQPFLVIGAVIIRT